MKIITESPSFMIDQRLSIGQSNWDLPEHLAIGQISMEKLFKTIAIEPTSVASPLVISDNSLDINSMIFNDPLMQDRKINGEQLLNRRIYNDGLLVMHKGVVIHESYRNGLTADDCHVIHSCTKSLCSMLVAIAIEDGLINASLEITAYLTEFGSLDAWQGVTVQHVLDMQAGIQYSEDYTDPNAQYWSYARAAGYYPPENGEAPIGAKSWAVNNLNTRNYHPGSTFVYNSCLANMLGMVLEKVHKKHLAEIFETVLYQRIGAEGTAYLNTDPQGFPIIEGQFNCRLRDFSRCASLMINKGKNLNGEQIIPKHFIDHLVKVDPLAQKAYQANRKDLLFTNGQYKNQFWVLDPEQKQFSMLGIHGQFAWFDLDRELMIIGLGSYPAQHGKLLSLSLNTLWQKVAQSV